MKKAIPALLFSFLFVSLPVAAQTTGSNVRNDILRHFDRSSSKMIRLSDAMPAELYQWSPGPGTMSVAKVYAHIARYNYYYFESSLGIAAPESVDLKTMEDEVEKDVVVSMLRESIMHAKKYIEAMSEEKLQSQVTLYGRQVEGWQVLTQLVSHMNEHVGQSVAYARMNGVVPPWSR